MHHGGDSADRVTAASAGSRVGEAFGWVSGGATRCLAWYYMIAVASGARMWQLVLLHWLPRRGGWSTHPEGRPDGGEAPCSVLAVVEGAAPPGLSWRCSMRCWLAGSGSSRAAGSRRSSCGGASGWCAGSLCLPGAGRGAGRRGRWRRGSPLAAGRIRRSGFTRGHWGASWTTYVILATAGQMSARPGWAHGPCRCVMGQRRGHVADYEGRRSGARCPGLSCRPCSTWLMTVSGGRRAGDARDG